MSYLITNGPTLLNLLNKRPFIIYLLQSYSLNPEGKSGWRQLSQKLKDTDKKVKKRVVVKSIGATAKFQ